jgi:ankyrin repeat protein
MSSANEKLRNAAKEGHVAEIERQIAAGADPNAFEGSTSATPLQWAAAGGHVAAMAVLLKAGAYVDGASSGGWTALMLAADYGHTAAIDALVAAGADVNRANNIGNTALHQASAYGQLDAARVLLEAGAKTDVRNKKGERPIDVVRHSLARSVCGRTIASRRCAAALPCAGLHPRHKHVERGRPACAAGAAARRDAARARHAGCHARRCWRRWCAVACGRCACRCWRRRFCACPRARRGRSCGGA